MASFQAEFVGVLLKGNPQLEHVPILAARRRKWNVAFPDGNLTAVRARLRDFLLVPFMLLRVSSSAATAHRESVYSEDSRERDAYCKRADEVPVE